MSVGDWVLRHAKRQAGLAVGDAGRALRDRSRADHLLHGDGSSDTRRQGELRALLIERDECRRTLGLRYERIVEAAVPVTRTLLDESVQALLVGNPDKTRRIKDRHLRRTHERLPDLLATAPSVTSTACASIKWPHCKEGEAASFTFTYPVEAVVAQGREWLSTQHPKQFGYASRAKRRGRDAIDHGIDNMLWHGDSFLVGAAASLALSGLAAAGAHRADAAVEKNAKVDSIDVVGELARARDHYESLLPRLAQCERQLAKVRLAVLKEAARTTPTDAPAPKTSSAPDSRPHEDAQAQRVRDIWRR